MSGAKGRSGGARPNSGPKPKPPPIVRLDGETPLEVMLALMQDDSVDARLRLQAAVAAAPYCHAKLGEGGKKEKQADKAKAAGEGRYKAPEPPKLVVSNGRS